MRSIGTEGHELTRKINLLMQSSGLAFWWDLTCSPTVAVTGVISPATIDSTGVLRSSWLSPSTAKFNDRRHPDRIEHSLATLVGQRIFGIALGHEDLDDHDRLRHDPTLAVLAGKLEAGRKDCAPVAGMPPRWRRSSAHGT